MRAYDDFNNYATGDDMLNRTGALTWKKINYSAFIFKDYPRFAGSVQYIGFAQYTDMYAVFDTSLITAYVGMAFMSSNHAESGELYGQYDAFRISFCDGSSGQYNFFHGGIAIAHWSGTITILDYNGYPIFSTPAGTVALNVWSYVEVSATIGHTGTIRVRVNGQDICSVPGDFMAHGSRGSASPAPTTDRVLLGTNNNWWWSLVDDFYYA